MRTRRRGRSISLVALGCILLMAVVIPTVRGGAAAPKQYFVNCTISHLKDGKAVVVSQPNLCVIDGQQGSFLAGGLIKAGEHGVTEDISIGEEVQATVKEAGDGKLNLSARISESEPVEAEGPGVIVRESAMRLVQTVKPGEPVVLKMDNGSAVRIVLEEHAPGATLSK